jgi:hypothetical protein
MARMSEMTNDERRMSKLETMIKMTDERRYEAGIHFDFAIKASSFVLYYFLLMPSVLNRVILGEIHLRSLVLRITAATMPARSEPARIPFFAASTDAVASNASMAMNSDIVKPIPARQA